MSVAEWSERAARRYCVLMGMDPDLMVSRPVNAPEALCRIQPQWHDFVKPAAECIFDSLMQRAVEETGGMRRPDDRP